MWSYCTVYPFNIWALVFLLITPSVCFLGPLGQSLQLQSPAGKWNEHLHKTLQQNKALNDLKCTGLGLDKNSVDQHQQLKWHLKQLPNEMQDLTEKMTAYRAIATNFSPGLFWLVFGSGVTTSRILPHFHYTYILHCVNNHLLYQCISWSFFSRLSVLVQYYYFIMIFIMFFFIRSCILSICFEINTQNTSLYVSDKFGWYMVQVSLFELYNWNKFPARLWIITMDVHL